MKRRLTAAMIALAAVPVVSCSTDRGVDLDDVSACSLINLAEAAKLGKIDRFGEVGTSDEGGNCEFTNDTRFALIRIDLRRDEPASRGYERLLETGSKPWKKWTEKIGGYTAQVAYWGPENIESCTVVVDTSDSQGFELMRTNGDKPADVCASALAATRVVLRTLDARAPQD